MSATEADLATYARRAGEYRALAATLEGFAAGPLDKQVRAAALTYAAECRADADKWSAEGSAGL